METNSNINTIATAKYKILFDRMAYAATSLKYPKIRFNTFNGNHRVVLSLASRGYIAIKVDGIYVGKLANENSFVMYQYQGTLMDEIMGFCASPIGSAKAYGQHYSNCCFCGIELTNKASLQMGYGPICADKYGLPWGFTTLIEEEDITLVDL